MRDAGIIGFVPRGNYSPTETYDFLHFVYFEGSTYVAKKKTTGNPPAENNEFWQILAKGEVGEYLPLTGGTLSDNKEIMLQLNNTSEIKQTILAFRHKGITSGMIIVDNDGSVHYWDSINGKTLFWIGKNKRELYDSASNSRKKIMVDGDPITPTVKQTEFKIKNRDLLITGVTGNTETDITDIIIKAYSGSRSSEGMRVGISPSNGMGYIQAQNFVIDCNLLSLEETRLLQTFYSIRFTRANDSDDYPRLMPATHNFVADMYFTNKDGTKLVTTKVQFLSDSSRNYFHYDLPSDFKTDTSSGNNLRLESREWLVATGIDVKKRG